MTKKFVIMETLIAKMGQVNDHGDMLTENDLQGALETYKDAIDPPAELVIEDGELKLVLYDKEGD